MRLATPVRAAVLGAVLVVASLVSASARAAGSDGSDQKEARRLFERAELSFNVGKFGEALADYQSAYEAKPLPGFLFNIAQCYRNMGNFERARFFFRRYLALEPHASNRHRVDELIAEMSRQLEAKPADASPAQTPPVALTPPPVAAPASPSPLAGEPRPADGLVTPLAPSGPVGGAAPGLAELAGTSAPLVTATASAPSRRPVWRRWWFWTGVAAVVAGGAVATFLLTRPETVAPGSLQPIDGR